MGLYGNLNTMSVAELLTWVGGGRKYGTLEVERDKIVKRVTFEHGRVASCSSNDPTTLMGQFLLSSGKITREMLSQGLSRQGSRQANLGQILLEMGAISQADREAFVAAKIEETIYGLFDWDDAVFRFYTDALPDPNAVDASFDVEQILRRGAERCAERKASGRALNDPRIVLRLTGEPPPPELATSRSARRIFDLIDGKKTVAEIILHSHASEFLVTKFLTALLHGEVVEIADVRPEPIRAAPPIPEIEPLAIPAMATVAQVAPATPIAEIEPLVKIGPAEEAKPIEEIEWVVDTTPAEESEPIEVIEPVVKTAPVASPTSIQQTEPVVATTRAAPTSWIQEIELGLQAAAAAEAEPIEEMGLDLETAPFVEHVPSAAAPRVEAADRTPPESGQRAHPRQPDQVSRELQSEINVALQLMASGQPEAALQLLNAIASAHPTDIALRKLVLNAEQDFCKKMLGGDLQASNVPTRSGRGAQNELSAEESFLIEHVDGHTDIQALLWIAPMRDVDVLKNLYSMLKKGWLELRAAA